MHRSNLLNLIEAALAAGQAAYARQAAQRYLADWPGDLGMQSALARARLVEGDQTLAVKTLEGLTAADPEDFIAQRLLGDLFRALDNLKAASLAYANAHIGDGLGAPKGLTLPAWAVASRAAYLAGRTGDWETARRESELAVESHTASPLPSLLHLCSLWHAGQLDLALPLAEGFHARWPGVVAFKLCLAECLLKNGEASRALALLHDAAAQDSAGQVATRHWGENHPYRALWETNVSLAEALPGPLPAELIIALGLNRLGGRSQKAEGGRRKAEIQGQEEGGRRQKPEASSASAHTPEEIAEIQAQLDALAEQLYSKNANLQSPITNYYVLLSSRTRLMQTYGLDGFTAINQALNALAASAETHTQTRLPPQSGQVRARVVYVDDPASVRPFGLRPVNPGSAWDIKMLLHDLAGQLKADGAAMGALLIVGGEEIVPFHRLPNPTDDVDADVPSDNPYATSDANYFIPEWPVGRIPSGAGKDPAPLLHALQAAADAYSEQANAQSRNWFARLIAWLFGPGITIRGKRSFGYSANVWKNASAAVYTTIGDPRDLLTCPPVDANALPVEGLAPSRFSYFNLHGVEDGPEWYGQRSYEDGFAVPEYPVALRPSDVVNSGRAPAIVFSEACYGANILGKTAENALCLRFLDSGTRALVASTKIAYGSVSAPLIGADLLGQLFWQNVNAGLPVGESLRRAKLQMAQEMHARQGFLDGEDQKTLLSFVLYGDPLTTAPGAPPPKSAKRWHPRFAEPPPPVCDRAEDEGANGVSPEMVAHVKSVVAQYLPGMRDAHWRVAHTHAHCAAKNHHCPTAQLAKTGPATRLSTRPLRTPHHTVVTLSKTIRVSARAHSHYARVTLDEKGKVVKVAVSR